MYRVKVTYRLILFDSPQYLEKRVVKAKKESCSYKGFVWFRLEKCDLYDANHWGNLSSFSRHTYVIFQFGDRSKWKLKKLAMILTYNDCDNSDFYMESFLTYSWPSQVLWRTKKVFEFNAFVMNLKKMSSIALGNFPPWYWQNIIRSMTNFHGIIFSAFKRGDSEIWYSQSPFLQNTEVL